MTEYLTRDDLSREAQTVIDTLDVTSGRGTEWDSYSALCAMFDIAHALYWLDPNSVPAAWQFRPSPYSGGLDIENCPDDRECEKHRGECTSMVLVLDTLGVDRADPYGSEVGWVAERALIEAGNALDPYAQRYSD